MAGATGFEAAFQKSNAQVPRDPATGIRAEPHCGHRLELSGDIGV